MNAWLTRCVRLLVVCLILSLWVDSDPAQAAPKASKSGVIDDKSDLNKDGIVDIDDLLLFSSSYLQRNAQTVDWCLFYESTIAGVRFDGMKTSYFLKHFKELLAFIREEFACEGGPFLLEFKNQPKYLFRVVAAGNGDFYISDPKVGSVFVYSPTLEPLLEFKGLSKPLGVAIDTRGRLLVGNDGRDNIEVYDIENGNLRDVFGSDLVLMPTNISIGPGGEILVTDSKNHIVWVFNADYQLIGKIGQPGSGPEDLNFPVDAEVIGRVVDGQVVYEVFVADQGNRRIQVFDMKGNYIDTIAAPGEVTEPGSGGSSCSWFAKLMGWCTDGTIIMDMDFTRLQSLGVDTQGRLHVLDIFESQVGVFDPATGAGVAAYGEYGQEPGYLVTPMDFAVTRYGSSLVVAGNGDRIEIIAIP